jgi:hypothetical protein
LGNILSAGIQELVSRVMPERLAHEADRERAWVTRAALCRKVDGKDRTSRQADQLAVESGAAGSHWAPTFRQRGASRWHSSLI